MSYIQIEQAVANLAKHLPKQMQLQLIKASSQDILQVGNFHFPIFWHTDHPQRLSNNIVRVFERVSSATAQNQQENKQLYLDLAGNAYLQQDNLFILISGKRRRETQAKKISVPLQHTGKAFQTSGLKLIFFLLCQPELSMASYRELANAANISLGSVSAALKDLEAHQLINAKRQITQRKQLIERWAQSYPYALRNKHLLGRYTTNNPDWYLALSADKNYQISGELAAQLKHNSLNAKSAVIYVGETGFHHVMQQGRLRKINEDENPEIIIEIYQAFWPLDETNLFAPELITYSDLLSANDPRCTEVATRMINELKI